MDELMYIICFAVIIALGFIGIIISILMNGGLTNQIGYGFFGVNKNISSIGTNAANAVNKSIGRFTNQSNKTLESFNKTANVLETSNANNTALIVNKLDSINHNTSALNANTSGLKGINTTVDLENGKLDQIIRQLNETNAIVANQVSSGGINVNGGQTIAIWTMSQETLHGHYLLNNMLDTFDMHIKLTSNNSTSVAVMSYAQYANFSQSLPYNTIAVYNSTGSSNTISFDFSTSEGCGGYLYIVYGTNGMEPIKIYPNVTGQYMPTAYLTGVCAT